jgi:hypothetical protein
MLIESDAGLEFDEMPHKDVVWDEDMSSDLDTHEEVLQKLALGSDYVTKQDTKPTVIQDVDEMLSSRWLMMANPMGTCIWENMELVLVWCCSLYARSMVLITSLHNVLTNAARIIYSLSFMKHVLGRR